MRIEESPSVVDDESRIGDWDIDTVTGKGHSWALVTIIERAT
jgi:IS30 family transposase